MSMDMTRLERKLLFAGLNKLDESLWNPTGEMCSSWRQDINKVKLILLAIGNNDYDILDKVVIVSPDGDRTGHDIGDALKKGLGDRPYHSDCEIAQAYVYFNSYAERKVWEILRELGLEDNAKVISVEERLYPEIHNWPSAERYWDKRINQLRTD